MEPLTDPLVVDMDHLHHVDNFDHLDNEDHAESGKIVPSAIREPVKRKMATRSKIWDEYTLIDLGIPGEQPKAWCSHCMTHSYVVDSYNGSSNMTRHLKKCKPYLAFKDKNAQVVQTFEQSVYRKLVAKAIIRHGYAFSWVEHEANREIHCYLSSQVRSICRNTAKADCLALQKALKIELKETLRSVPGSICLTSDMWTSCQTLGYMCLTAHYVDSTWTLQSKVLNFVHLETGHSRHEMYSEVIKLLQEWGIEDKNFSRHVRLGPVLGRVEGSSIGGSLDCAASAPYWTRITAGKQFFRD